MNALLDFLLPPLLSVFSVPLWFNRFLPVTHGYKALPRTTGRGRQHAHVKHL
jgi:hypothetical protein